MYVDFRQQDRNPGRWVPANDAKREIFDREDFDAERSQAAAMHELAWTIAGIVTIVVAVNLLLGLFFPY